MIDLERTSNGNYLCPSDPGEIGCGTAPRRSVTDEEVSRIGELFANRFVLEIGTGLGVSTRALAALAVAVIT